MKVYNDEEVKDIEALFDTKKLCEPFTWYSNELVKWYINTDNFRIEEYDNDTLIIHGDNDECEQIMFKFEGKVCHICRPVIESLWNPDVITGYKEIEMVSSKIAKSFIRCMGYSHMRWLDQVRVGDFIHRHTRHSQGLINDINKYLK